MRSLADVIDLDVDNKPRIKFNKYYYEKICALALEGRTIVEIAQMENMPSVDVLYSWIRRYKILKDGLNSSKHFRKEFLVDLKQDLLHSTKLFQR